MKWRDEPMDIRDARRRSSPALTVVSQVLLMALFLWAAGDLFAWHPLALFIGGLGCLVLGAALEEVE